MTKWIRYEQAGAIGFGQLRGDDIHVFAGNIFKTPTPTGETLRLDTVDVLTPCTPTKMIALWNNFRALAEKTGPDDST